MRVTTLIGVYDARGSIGGEIAYVLRKITGRGHCALCDITHSWVGRRRSFDDCRASLAVPLELFHLDDQPDHVRSVSIGRTPLIVAVLEDGRVREMLSSDELSACSSSPSRLIEAIEIRLRELEETTP